MQQILVALDKNSHIGQVEKTHISFSEGLFEQEEEQLYKVVLKLWPIGEVVLEKLHFLPKIDCDMIQMEEKNDHPIHFYKHEPRETLTFDEIVDITIKDKKIASWIVTTKELVELNLGTQAEHQDVLVSVILPIAFQLQVKNLLIDYKYVFAWSYKELKGIPREICEHKIQLMANAQSIK